MRSKYHAAWGGILLALVASLPAEAQRRQAVCNNMLSIYEGWSEREGTPTGIAVTYHVRLVTHRPGPMSVRVIMASVPGNFPVVSTGAGGIDTSRGQTAFRVVTIKVPNNAAQPSVESLLSGVRWICS